VLVLSRKTNERVMIGPDIILTVIEIDAHRVRLGIEAPPETKIWREELLARVRAVPPEEPTAPPTEDRLGD
jgi:carbon storage regulator